MYIVKHGDESKRNPDFKFKCNRCGCEWVSWVTDKEIHISPPSMEYFASTYCPDCGYYTIDEKGKKHFEERKPQK